MLPPPLVDGVAILEIVDEHLFCIFCYDYALNEAR